MLRRMVMVASIAALLGACEAEETANAQPRSGQSGHAEARKLTSPKPEAGMAQAEPSAPTAEQPTREIGAAEPEEAGADRLSDVGQPVPLPEPPAASDGAEDGRLAQAAPAEVAPAPRTPFEEDEGPSNTEDEYEDTFGDTNAFD